jgi:hypothetical protein
MFFSRDDYFERGLGWYEHSFFRRAGGHTAIGEATPHYLYWAEKVAPRIRQAYGHVPPKLLIILRDPVQRAHSWYWNMVREGQESLPFIQALQAEDSRLQAEWDGLRSSGSMRFGYVRGGCYAAQIREFAAHFPVESIHVLLLEDLQNDQGAAMKAVCGFLRGPDFLRPARSNPHRCRARCTGARTINAQRLLKPLLPQELRYRLKKMLINLNLRDADQPALAGEAVQFLTARFAAANAELPALLGRDLSRWS